MMLMVLHVLIWDVTGETGAAAGEGKEGVDEERSEPQARRRQRREVMGLWGGAVGGGGGSSGGGRGGLVVSDKTFAINLRRPQIQTPNPKLQTPNPKPETRKVCLNTTVSQRRSAAPKLNPKS
jgi:hypothetical protein